ncbi:MAG: M14 family zinc carboxypeptidase [Bacteroidota bacterium]
MRLLLFSLFFVSVIPLSAQQYSKVKINLKGDYTLKKLAQLGFETDHGDYRPGVHFTNVFSENEIQLLTENEFEFEVLIDDMTADYLERNKQGLAESTKALFCEDEEVTAFQTPANYTFGTMGGYHTYQEMLDILDSMAVKYPDIFKARQPITTAYTTHDGHPIYWVKISDNPSIDEDEPEVFYNSIHHAREPNAMSQMIFHMWYLLENYETDEFIQHLINNTEMYFVPCINVDGYLYNESTNPNGGGFWRKNRRDNGDGSYGVDLNRNYPFQWGFDDDGSSPNTSSETYRGPSPGSEPETQMIMEFCNAHEFQIALCYHTHGDLLIYPWGYVDGPSPDDEIFKGFASFMVKENNYLAGYASETVGYTVNGTSDDWFYGEQATKSRILSMTPEVGPQFWPSEGEIDGLNKTAMDMNIKAAALLLNYGEVTPKGELLTTELNGEIEYDILKIGLKQGLLSVSLEPVSDNILNVGSDDNFGLFNLEETSGSIGYLLNSDIEEGEEIEFNLVLDNGNYQWRKNVRRIYSQSLETAFAEPGDDFSQWTNFGSWDVTSDEFYSPSTSITDSPGAFYENNQANETEMVDPVQLQNAVAAYLSFWAKWDIEEDYDYVQVLLSVDGGAPFPLCGKYTQPGVNFQPEDEPVYDGTSDEWLFEEINLTDYLPEDGNVEFTVSFRLLSDGFVTGDGFYFDDLKITAVEKVLNSTNDFDPHELQITNRPNPASDHVYLDIASSQPNLFGYNLQISNSFGQAVYTENIRDNKVIKIETRHWQSGVYQFFVTDGKRKSKTGRFVIAN